MAGAWEWKKNHQVLVGILHCDIVSMAWAQGFRNLQIPGQVCPVAGMPYDMARDSICWQALHNGYDYAFHLDSDVVPPPDVIHRLMAHNLPLVAGIYHRRSPPHGVPVMIKGGGWLVNYPKDTLIEVDFTGAGCLLMRRDLLELLAKHPMDPQRGKVFFDWRVNMANILPPREALSEDFAMNLYIKRKWGIKTMIDTSVLCRHIGLADAVPGAMIPCQVVA